MLTEAISALITDFGDSVSPRGAPPALSSSWVCWEGVAEPDGVGTREYCVLSQGHCWGLCLVTRRVAGIWTSSLQFEGLMSPNS